MKKSFVVLLLYCFIPLFSAKKILVTGGAGFIGSHVAQALVKRGDIVIIIDNLNDYYSRALKEHNLSCVFAHAQPDQVRFYKDDICDRNAIETIFTLEKPDSICHLAARAGVRPSVNNPDLYIQTNISGTLTLLEMAHTFSIAHTVLASSSSVYGAECTMPFLESDRCDTPCSPYAATKRACELLAYTYHHLYDISISCLRFFTVYGPRGRIDMAPFKFIDAIYNENVIEQYGNGTAMRDFTYIDDIVDGVIKALETPCGFEIFNLGRGEPVVLQDFISTIEQVVGKKAHIKIVDTVPGDVPYTCANIEKAQKLLGYAPKVSIHEGVQKLYDWYWAFFR